MVENGYRLISEHIPHFRPDGIWFRGHGPLALPSINELARSCKIVQEFCKNLECKTCLARARDMSLFLRVSCTILAQSCTYLARNGARFCKSCCKNNYLHFLHIFCKILQELVQDCARIVQEKGHIACMCQASLARKILARFLHNLASSFCWVPIPMPKHSHAASNTCITCCMLSAMSES